MLRRRCERRDGGKKYPQVTSARDNPAMLRLALLAVADAIDRAGPVVGDEDRTILVQDDVVGTAKIALVAVDPAGRKDFLLWILAIRADRDADDAATLVLVPVP